MSAGEDEAESSDGSPAPQGAAAGQGNDAIAPKARSWYTDWRVWLGIAITVLALWLAMRGVPLAEVQAAMAGANAGFLVVASVPCYVLSVYFRALRWRHLTAPIAPMETATLFRSTAIGFMVNNLVPLRIGEFVRSWHLARETGTPATAIFGTVVLERVIDLASVLLLAAFSLAWLGASSDESGILAQGAILLLPIGVAPLAALMLLRVAPEGCLRVFAVVCRPLPSALAARLERMLRDFIAGLGALSGGTHLFWLAFHSIWIWLVFSALPVTIALIAFGIDLGGPVELMVSSWVLLAGVGVAVALPSAPGFFGTYQLAYKAILVGMGVDPGTALALGLLVWVVFWVTLTALGLIVLRGRHISLGELTHAPGKDPSADRR